MTEVFAMWRWEYLWADRQLFGGRIHRDCETCSRRIDISVGFGIYSRIASTLSSKLIRPLPEYTWNCSETFH